MIANLSKFSELRSPPVEEEVGSVASVLFFLTRKSKIADFHTRAWNLAIIFKGCLAVWSVLLQILLYYLLYYYRSVLFPSSNSAGRKLYNSWRVLTLQFFLHLLSLVVFRRSLTIVFCFFNFYSRIVTIYFKYYTSCFKCILLLLLLIIGDGDYISRGKKFKD